MIQHLKFWISVSCSSPAFKTFFFHQWCLQIKWSSISSKNPSLTHFAVSSTASKHAAALHCFQSPLLLKLHQIWWVKPKAKSLLLLITLEQAKCWPATQQTSDHLNFQASRYTASKVDEITPTHKSNSKLVSEFHSTIFPYNLSFLFSTLQLVNYTWQCNKRDKCNNNNNNNHTEISFSDLSETKTHKLYFVRNWGLGWASQPASVTHSPTITKKIAFQQHLNRRRWWIRFMPHLCKCNQWERNFIVATTESTSLLILFQNKIAWLWRQAKAKGR
jgi:hypothetical protein